MKAITLKQPWATLISEGIKIYEFRNWKTNYRGEVLIHSGKGVSENGMKQVNSFNLEYPKSRILSLVKIVDCIELTENKMKEIIKENPIIYGEEIKTAKYVWKLQLVKKVNFDKEINGKLSFWNYDIDEIIQ